MSPNENFHNIKTPLEKNDHPELENTELCNEDQVMKYMCMIGQLQWAVMLGRYDILAHVMSMSRVKLAPKTGHLERLKRLYRYLSKTKHFAIRSRTKEPNYSHLLVQEHDWPRTVYGNVKEEIPKDIPKLLVIRVITTTFLDANLQNDSVTGKTVTAAVHFINTFPVEWYLKKTSRCGNSHIWFRVCSCKNSN